jgi:hypothetical protein
VSAPQRARADQSHDDAASDPYLVQLARLGLSDQQASTLTDEEIVRRLVESGTSRLTGERIVAVGRGAADAGRARVHSLSRRR